MKNINKFQVGAAVLGGLLAAAIFTFMLAPKLSHALGHPKPTCPPSCGDEPVSAAVALPVTSGQ